MPVGLQFVAPLLREADLVGAMRIAERLLAVDGVPREVME
jgi:hypothetical protein